MIYTRYENAINEARGTSQTYQEISQDLPDYLSFKVQNVKLKLWKEYAYVALEKTGVQGVSLGWLLGQEREILIVKEVVSRTLNFSEKYLGVPRLLNRFIKNSKKQGLPLSYSVYSLTGESVKSDYLSDNQTAYQRLTSLLSLANVWKFMESQKLSFCSAPFFMCDESKGKLELVPHNIEVGTHPEENIRPYFERFFVTYFKEDYLADMPLDSLILKIKAVIYELRFSCMFKPLSEEQIGVLQSEIISRAAEVEKDFSTLRGMPLSLTPHAYVKTFPLENNKMGYMVSVGDQLGMGKLKHPFFGVFISDEGALPCCNYFFDSLKDSRRAIKIAREEQFSAVLKGASFVLPILHQRKYYDFRFGKVLEQVVPFYHTELSPKILPMLSEKMLYNIFLQVIKGLKNFHDREIIYLDLKPENVFLSVESHDQVTVVIGDIGGCRFASDSGYGQYNILYGSPEGLGGQLSDVNMTTKAHDIWSLAIFMLESFYNIELDNLECYHKIYKNFNKIPGGFEEPGLYRKFLDALKQDLEPIKNSLPPTFLGKLLIDMLDFNYRERIGIDQVLSRFELIVSQIDD